jgi:diaminopimelate epimerase
MTAPSMPGRPRTHPLPFVKAHGAGNDFVLLPDLEDALELDEALVRALCTPHLGVGADGVIRLGSGGTEADVFMDYRNADGSLAEMCGNGVRCVAKYMVDRGLVSGEVVRVGSRGGLKPVEIVERHADGTVARVRVDMGAPEPTGTVSVDVSPERVAQHLGTATAVTLEHRTVELTTLSMGNPHAVLVVPDVGTAPVAAWGPVIEHDEAFPKGTNVEFIAVPERTRVVGRIWERGVGETLASGTGSSAMAAAAHLLGLADRDVVVELPGGTLAVEWTADTLHVTGPAVEVAAGELDASWLAAVQRRRQPHGRA